MTEGIIIAIIGAIGAIIAAIIVGKYTIKAARMNKPKYPSEKTTKEPLNIPKIAETPKNPFELPLEGQELGSEEYIEAMGTSLMESRSSNDIHITRI